MDHIDLKAIEFNACNGKTVASIRINDPGLWTSETSCIGVIVTFTDGSLLAIEEAGYDGWLEYEFKPRPKMNRQIEVYDAAGNRIASGFANVICAAIWCNNNGYAHPLLEHARYHVKGEVTFASNITDEPISAPIIYL